MGTSQIAQYSPCQAPGAIFDYGFSSISLLSSLLMEFWVEVRGGKRSCPTVITTR